MPSADIPGILTVNDYLALGREIARLAASGLPGTYTKERDNGEILVYWEPAAGLPGLFMAVSPIGTRGEIKTLFSPQEGKQYFDDQAISGFRRTTLH